MGWIPVGYKSTEEYKAHVIERQTNARNKWADDMAKVFTLNHAQTLQDISHNLGAVSNDLYDSLDSEYDYPTLFGSNDIKDKLHTLRQTVNELWSYMDRLEEKSWE